MFIIDPFFGYYLPDERSINDHFNTLVHSGGPAGWHFLHIHPLERPMLALSSFTLLP
jgi:hypothetical protein